MLEVCTFGPGSVDDFRISSKEDLYKKALKTDWSLIMDAESTFSVVPVVNSPLFGHTGYPALIIKDAIADYFRNRTGRRPSVDPSDPRVMINLHISNADVNISIDSTVIPLYKRGYRKVQGPAPLNEVLAAGILKLTGWDGTAPLYDPMCGSGTILIEAALMASGIAPGKYRQHFGFMRWKNFNAELFDRVKAECDGRIMRNEAVISGSDISEQAIAYALENIESAGLSEAIKVEVCDFRNTKPAEPGGFLVFNPPYGQRLQAGQEGELYEMIGTTLKHNYPGYKAWIITSGRELIKKIGLKAKSRFTLYNGALECILAGYELYEGSKKARSQ